jgi:hypothetical protein
MNRLLLPLLALLAFLPQRGSADTTLGTAITAVPYTITAPGVYYFKSNLGYSTTSGVAIRIEAIDVVLDLNGFELASSGSANTSYGIRCNQFDRATVKNGTIRGFQNAVQLLSNACNLSNLLVAGNFETGISVIGNNAEIVGNHVCDTGGSTAAGVTSATGISLTGSDGTIVDNDIQTTFVTDKSTHTCNGILVDGCSNIVVSNNRVIDVEPPVPEFASTNGIAALSSENLIILGNTVLSARTGFDLSGAASGKFGDNITGTVSIPYNTTGSGMTNIGNNN